MRDIRCQAVILKRDRVLVARQYNSRRNEEYWMLPGGNVENGETPENAIKRELREETNLEVHIKAILFDEIGNRGDSYNRYITYLCFPKLGSELKVGSETTTFRTILDLVWCSVTNEDSYNEYVLKEQFYPSMKEIKNKLIKFGEL